MIDLRKIYIEELVSDYPQAVAFLARRGIACLVCGEPVWGTLEELLRKKGFNEAEIDELVRNLIDFLGQTE